MQLSKEQFAEQYFQKPAGWQTRKEEFEGFHGLDLDVERDKIIESEYQLYLQRVGATKDE